MPLENVGFAADDDFQGDDTGLLREVLPVRYKRGCSGVTFHPDSHSSIFTDKFEDWSYEDEVRVILPLDECEEISPRLHLYQISKCRVARLILGWKMPPAEEDKIRGDAREIRSDLKVVRARMTRSGEVVIPD